MCIKKYHVQLFCYQKFKLFKKNGIIWQIGLHTRDNDYIICANKPLGSALGFHKENLKGVLWFFIKETSREYFFRKDSVDKKTREGSV